MITRSGNSSNTARISRDQRVDFRAILAVDAQIFPLRVAPALDVSGIRRVVAELIVLDHPVDHIHAETIDAARSQKRIASNIACLTAGIAPVEVGLLRQKVVQIILLRGFVPRPRRAAEVGEPVVRRAPSGLASRQMYQSRLGLSRDERDSRNHGARSRCGSARGRE